ncbi:MAG: hypothetical protein IPI67_09595 [Myxococcales bacterium]|nr:hypothetical protein [Myxococcales bacterium]
MCSKNLLPLFLAALVVAGCGKGDGEPKPKPKPDVVVDLEILPADFVAENQPLKLLSEGDPIALVPAPQGGHVIHVGARVLGLTSDTVNLRSRLRDPASNAIQMEEARDVVMKPVPGQPGWMEPDLRSVSQVTHIPACPNYDADVIVDAPWKLEVIIDEIDGPGLGSASVVVKPACAQTDPTQLALCQCECGPGYVLGKCATTK